ncbi:MAG: SusD/RagB family nutrient-binding outer membrane lipoprotein [Bacteroidales bacterium]|nr:SusD/RagB family nutrient-binding outer membrane lipoprotein [Bacteroidales bacterium]
MKYIKSISASLVLAGALAVSSCDPSDFGNINDTPNNPTQSYTYMLFKSACTSLPTYIMSSSSYDPWAQEWSGYLAEAKNNQYGGLITTMEYASGGIYTGPIRTLTEIIKSNTDEATKGDPAVTMFGTNNNQIAACVTLRSFYYMTISDILGPIVYSEALQSGEENWAPKYDSQKDVYAGLEKELNEAYALFDEKSNLTSDDLIFKGNIARWKKFNATLRMMMAIKLSDVAPADGKARFAKAYADGGMETADDSFTWTYHTGSNAPFYSIGNMGYASRSNYFAPNKIFVDALKEYKDPRLFTYCNVGDNAYMGKVAGDPHDFNTYKGVPHGLASNGDVDIAIVGACSTAAKYCEPTPTYGLITAARCLLVEAEAAQRGWIDAKPAELYAKGIQASFDFEAKSDDAWAKEFKNAKDYIAAHPLPQDNDAALKEIAMQRFLAGFLTDGIEAWSDWRRLNVPTMVMYPGQSNTGKTTYPYRLTFASNDYSVNRDNTNAAAADLQGGKGDDKWSRVWWDVAENPCPKAE